MIVVSRKMKTKTRELKCHVTVFYFQTRIKKDAYTVVLKLIKCDSVLCFYQNKYITDKNNNKF